MNQLHKRIFDISYKNKLSHIGSCITAVDLIDHIYSIKKKDEKFVLSSGHAGLALYVVIEKYEGIDAEKIWKHHGTHPDRCAECHIDCSSGSLGNGLPISLGMAFADRSKTVYCLVSDGECNEGSIWEALRIGYEYHVTNLAIVFNFNGYGAYKEIDGRKLKEGIENYCHSFDANGPHLFFQETSMKEYPSFLQGQQAHYHILTAKEYFDIMGEYDKSNIGKTPEMEGRKI